MSPSHALPLRPGSPFPVVAGPFSLRLRIEPVGTEPQLTPGLCWLRSTTQLRPPGSKATAQSPEPRPRPHNVCEEVWPQASDPRKLCVGTLTSRSGLTQSRAAPGSPPRTLPLSDTMTALLGWKGRGPGSGELRGEKEPTGAVLLRGSAVGVILERSAAVQCGQAPGYPKAPAGGRWSGTVLCQGASIRVSSRPCLCPG